MGVFRNIVDDNKFTPEDVPPFEDKLFFEGAKRRVNLERFAVLLFLSTVIATYGVLGDSTATIIGAMIIAPLMIPIMGTAAGLVMGDMGRAGRSFLKVVGGVAGVIFTAWFIGTFLNTTVVSFTTNSAITGRISPSLTDLMIALASGAAGAFAMSRSDVADSLPGLMRGWYWSLRGRVGHCLGCNVAVSYQLLVNLIGRRWSAGSARFKRGQHQRANRHRPAQSIYHHCHRGAAGRHSAGRDFNQGRN
jgi:uncharacterized hydrophobic protein (TIGR00271 family)